MDQFLEFAGNHVLLVVAAFLMGGMAIAYELRLRTRGFTEVTPLQAVDLMNSSAVVVDVREPDQFANGHIVGAKNIPLATLNEKAAEKISRQADKTAIVYCATGISGAKAAAELKKLGLTRVVNLKGGLDAWRRENYPLQKRGKK